MNELLKKMALAGVGVMLLGGVAFANVGNDHTGYDSENDASLEAKSEVEVENDNDADIWNHIKGIAGSGYNEAEKNTGDGAVDTGNASGTVRITNTANDNMTSVDACGGCSFSGVSVMNSTTGADSDNDAWVKMHNEVEVENDNDADVHNELCLTASSGGNEASFNTGDGMVDTGSATLDVTITNTLNANNTTVE